MYVTIEQHKLDYSNFGYVYMTKVDTYSGSVIALRDQHYALVEAPVNHETCVTSVYSIFYPASPK